MSHAGQYLPGNSLLHRLEPRGKFFGFLILIIAAVLTDSPLGYLLRFAVAGGIVALSGLPVQVVLGTVLRMGRFFVLIFVLNTLFFSSETPIFHWWIITISREGMVQGANVVLRIIVILILSNAFTLTTPPIVLTDGLERLLSPLRVVHFPAHEMAMMMSIALRFIPTLLEEADKIMKAQTARGADFESGNLIQRAKAMVPLLVPLFVGAFRRAEELALAMDARCYRGGAGRTRMHQLKYRTIDLIAALIIVALFALVILANRYCPF